MRTQTIDIDFAPAARAPRPLGLVLLGVGALLTLLGGLVWSEAWSAQRAQAHSLSALLGREAASEAKPARAGPATAGELARSRATLNVAHELQTPWSELLSALEAAPHSSVALLLVEPSIAKQQVRLTAEARQIDAMLDYLAALQSDARLSQVVLLSHQVQTKSPGNPVRFQLQAAWGGQP